MSAESVQSLPESRSLIHNLQRVLRQNIRDYGMFIALFAIMAYFAIATGGVFTSARNLSNLLNQTGYIAVLAIGMTLVIVIRQIDLSVGFLAGFLGAIAAIALTQWGLSVWLVLPLVLGLGIIAGLITAFPVAKLGIPSFVASLAGWLIYRGALQLVTEGTGTIVISDNVFNAIGNDFIPDLPIGILEGVHKLTLLLGIATIVAFITSELRTRRTKEAYGFEVLPNDIFALKLIFISAIVAAVSWVIASYNGIDRKSVV